MYAIGAQFFVEKKKPGQAAISLVGTFPGINVVKIKYRRGRFFCFYGMGRASFYAPLYKHVGSSECPGFFNSNDFGAVIYIANLNDVANFFHYRISC